MACCSCTHTPSVVDLPFLEQYAREPGNGLIADHTTNGIHTTVRLVPGAIGALREDLTAKDSCHARLKELLDFHDKQLCFVLNLAPDTAHYKGDVMYAGVRTVEEFKEQAFALNFSWADEVELHCDSEVYRPVLSTLENTYSLTKDRNVVLVFSPESRTDSAFFHSKDLELVVHDNWLGTGLQHFKFHRVDLQKVPAPTV
jgi:hypothetical protein